MKFEKSTKEFQLEAEYFTKKINLAKQCAVSEFCKRLCKGRAPDDPVVTAVNAEFEKTVNEF